MARLLVDLRGEWVVQILVLFSFKLQVFLLIFADIRRHNVSLVPRMLLWLAYQLADSTALFTLGHMFISSRPPEQQQLMALWAPFLLVHLGGQDTITAYSFEDNRLWLRHLQTLVVQVLGATYVLYRPSVLLVHLGGQDTITAYSFEDNRLWLRHLQTLVVQVLGATYVLYRYIPGSESLVLVAAVLIFVVGVLKYGERIWALRCASLESIWSSLEKSESEASDRRQTFLLAAHSNFVDPAEVVLMAAHSLMDVCKGLFVGLRRGQSEYVSNVMRFFFARNNLDKLMETELSLMYDIMYTKAVVIHTWYGCCVRVVSLVATVAAFLLFQFSSKDAHKTNDVAVTYILLVGALVLETASLLRAVGSTWSALYTRKWRWLHEVYLSCRRLVSAERGRKWSGSVGQFSMLESCKPTPTSIIARLVGLEEWWWQVRHSWSVKISDFTKELVSSKILVMGNRREAGSRPGLLTLQRFKPDEDEDTDLNESDAYVWWSIQDAGIEDRNIARSIAIDNYERFKPDKDDYEYIRWSIEGIDLEDSIIAWHIATDIYLYEVGCSLVELSEAIRVLSNYMMFLLAVRPYMLPGPVRHRRVAQTRDDLYGTLKRFARDDLFHNLSRKFGTIPIDLSDRPPTCLIGVKLATVLLSCYKQRTADVIFGVWVEMLGYVADNCSRESHARQRIPHHHVAYRRARKHVYRLRL